MGIVSDVEMWSIKIVGSGWKTSVGNELNPTLAATSTSGNLYKLYLWPVWPACPLRSPLGPSAFCLNRTSGTSESNHCWIVDTRGREPEGRRTEEWERVGFIDRLVWDVLLRSPLGMQLSVAQLRQKTVSQISFQSVNVCGGRVWEIQLCTAL